MRIQPAPLAFALTIRRGVIDPEILFDLVIQACFNGDAYGPEGQDSTLVESLIASYCTALEAADEDEGRLYSDIVPCYTDREEAERAFNAVYLSVYDLDEPCGWPDVLPYYSVGKTDAIPKRIVHTIAQAIAQRDNAGLRQLRALAAQGAA